MTETINIYLYILNGLHISNESQYYNVQRNISDVVVINKLVDEDINNIYDMIINKKDTINDYYLTDIFDKIIEHPKNDIKENDVNRQIKLPNYLFYPEQYKHKNQLIMGLYKTTLVVPIKKEFSYYYTNTEKLLSNSDMNGLYTYNYLFYMIKDRTQSNVVGFYISNINETPLYDKIRPSYNIYNNIEFLGPNEINNKIYPLIIPFKRDNINEIIWNGNIGQYHLGCALSTLLYHNLISYKFAVNELSKISGNGTSMWRILEYYIINNNINKKLGVFRFPFKIGFLFLIDILMKHKSNNIFIIYKTCNNHEPQKLANDFGHTASIVKLNNNIYNIDAYANKFDLIRDLNVNKYNLFKYPYIDIPFELNDNGITLTQLKELKGFVRTRLPLSIVNFGGE